MVYLVIVSLVWAFSFGLIKGKLVGVDPTAVATLRLGLALLIFLPLCRIRNLTATRILTLMAIGAVQFGLMYLVYLKAFAYLQAYEVALFTITTPLFVALADAALRRSLEPAHLLAATLAVVGAGVIVWQRLPTTGVGTGLCLVQASNICFAIGQIAWRRFRPLLTDEPSDAAVFALLYAGALAVALAWSFATTSWSALHLTSSQLVTIAYLGVLASGLCFFWWNRGATRVNAGTLAVLNNAKIPLAVACSLLFFGEHADVTRLVLGGAFLGAGVWLAERLRRSQPA